MILGVAVIQKNLMICLPKPSRHCDCILYAVNVLGLTPPVAGNPRHQGFYTADGTYMERAEALLYAKEHDQLINKDAKSYLFSEDLW
jgi:hypothetical protein